MLILTSNRLGNRLGFDAMIAARFCMCETESHHVRAIASRPVPSRPGLKDEEPDRSHIHLGFSFSTTAELPFLGAALSRAGAREARGRVRPGAREAAPPTRAVASASKDKAPRRGWNRPGHGNEEVTSMQDEPTRPEWHRVMVIDQDGRWGWCSVCGPCVELRRRVRRGNVEWSCMRKHRSYDPPRGRRNATSYRRANTGVCAECGFVAIHPAQIDIHHADGDHSNNDPYNLVSLCANCHRLWHVMGSNGFEIAAACRGVTT